MIQSMVFILVLAMSVFTIHAQKAADFSGKWTLDVAKSKLGDRNTIESQTMTVTQTSADIKIETATKRTAPPARGPGGGRGAGGGGAMGGGDGTSIYTLDGKAVESEISGPMGSMKVSTKAKIEGGKLEITRTVATPMGDRATTEKWWLNPDGTLSIESQRPNRDGGMDTTTRVFTKS